MDTGEQAKGERRRHLRVWAWKSEGWIAPDHKVSLLDISQGGALIEHWHLLRLDTVLFLTLVLLEREITLRCRVARMHDQRYEVSPSGAHDHVYRTGLEFQVLSEKSKGLLEKYIDSLREEG